MTTDDRRAKSASDEVLPLRSLEVAVDGKESRLTGVVDDPFGHRPGEAWMRNAHQQFAARLQHAVGFADSAGVILDVHQRHGGDNQVKCRRRNGVQGVGIRTDVGDVEALGARPLGSDFDETSAPIDSSHSCAAPRKLARISPLTTSHVEHRSSFHIAEHLQHQRKEEKISIVICVSVPDPIVCHLFPGARGTVFVHDRFWRSRMDSRAIIGSLFGAPRALIGVIHLDALPGTPRSRRDVRDIVELAVAEAGLYARAGFHGVMIENTHDRPYLKGTAGPEISVTMGVIGSEIRRAVSLPLGIQVLAAANRSSIAVAHACGASFVRVEGFVFSHVADEGFMESDAGDLLRYRRAIGADAVRVFADVKKKHSAHAITADVGIAETAKAAEFFLADGIIVTGISTGTPAAPEDVREVSASVGLPTIVGSGITPENISRYEAADAFIVGSSVKTDGVWSSPLDQERARAVVRAFQNLSH